MPLPERLLATLNAWPVPASYWVAYSGGLDSTVLLHALAAVRTELPAPLHAVHVHHGLLPDADGWAAHCLEACQALGVRCETLRQQVPRARGESIEAAARRARYAAFADVLTRGGMLLTAHHREDQVETVLLQLLRGAGPAGLAGIGELQAHGGGWIGRPLLEFERATLRSYAERRALRWVEDPSNRDLRIDRNYLRHRVLPRLRERWPGLDATVSRSARHCGATAYLANELAEQLFRADARHRPYRLAVAPLLGLAGEHQALLLRHWLARSGLPVPDTRRLRRLITEVAQARPDATPYVRWRGAEVRRFGGSLYAMPPLAAPPAPGTLAWQGDSVLELPAGLGCLRLTQRGLALPQPAWLAARVEVRFGAGGFVATPAGRRGRRSFKRLCQEWGIPPWLRARLPLVFLDGHLAALGDYGSCEPFAVRLGEPAVYLTWERPAYLA